MAAHQHSDQTGGEQTNRIYTKKLAFNHATENLRLGCNLQVLEVQLVMGWLKVSVAKNHGY